ncbi:MAG: TIGR03016 family PEP-CTERM system-associated outer membrane protein [Chromatiaceae bacterium]|nr:TIGR03016 family PEP-CTERM system-associated outer membrane protein [Chromatiaceae bacterium]
MKPKRWSSLVACLLFILTIVSQQASAATWRTTKGLTNELVYTDNVNLSADDERGGLSSRIAPRISVQGSGRGMKLNFGYSPSYLYRFYSGGDNGFDHNLSANLESELYQDLLFLDAKANGGLRLVDPFGNNPGDGINESDNVRQNFSLSVSPYIRQHFGSYADLKIGYSYSKVWNDGFSSSDGHAADFDLTSGRRFQIVDWGINGSIQQTKYQDGDDSIFANVKGRVGYAINRSWRINAFIGYDDNEFLDQAGERSTTESGGFAYGGGFTWTPSSRTSFDFSVADRFFGTNLYFNFKHKSRRSVWTASLTHEPTNARNESLSSQTFQTTDAFGEPILDPSGEPVYIDPDAPLFSSEDYVRRKLELGYVRTLRRGELGISGFYTERDYSDNRRDTSGYGITANYSRNLLSQFNGDLRISWTNNSSGDGSSDLTNWIVAAGINRQLSARTNLAFNLQHRRQVSDEPSDEYSENRATLTLGTTW